MWAILKLSSKNKKIHSFVEKVGENVKDKCEKSKGQLSLYNFC